MVMWLHDWEFLALGHHAANFGEFRDCGRVDKIFSICDLISKDYVFNRLSGFLGVSLL